MILFSMFITNSFADAAHHSDLYWGCLKAYYITLSGGLFTLFLLYHLVTLRDEKEEVCRFVNYLSAVCSSSLNREEKASRVMRMNVGSSQSGRYSKNTPFPSFTR